MANFKLVISDPKKAKSEVLEVKDSNAQLFMGRRIGEVVDAASSGYNGKLRITGGSDRAGFPMRGDVLGGGKRYILLIKGMGFKKAAERVKRTTLVRGNPVREEVDQTNGKTVE